MPDRGNQAPCTSSPGGSVPTEHVSHGLVDRDPRGSADGGDGGDAALGGQLPG